MRIDTSGSPISLVRIDPEKAYSNIYTLLQSYINRHDQFAWEQLKEKIDYIYYNITTLLDTLDHETNFKSKVLSQLATGKKLLFKINGVSVNVIDENTHGAGTGAPVCTPWLFVAALMRYFHDSLDINYYQMTMGEAPPSDDVFAKLYSLLARRAISHESTLEGKNEDFYGGYGFYFVRKYLYERHPLGHTDNPMNGYENSVNGQYLPPGKANDRLMVYDLNDVNSSNRGRTIRIPNGGNFKTITMHKAVIGGDTSEKDDYPGCILINIPILKMHFMDLITNAIKNLGIGLYPGFCEDQEKRTNKYAHHNNFKSKLPHSRWIMDLDEKTFLPRTDENGNYIREQTLGFSGTQCDIINGLKDQGIFILHICDAINIVNISHMPDGKCIPIPEGLIFSSLDPLALDYCCARYCFNQLSMRDGTILKEKNEWPTEFVQKTPLPYLKGNAILTKTGYDSPLFRYPLYDYAAEHGIGQKKYYVRGSDTITNAPFVSVNGHLGRIENHFFVDYLTNTMYYNPGSLLHDLQLMVLSYAKCNDALTGTSLYDEFMERYDENHDGIIDYDEKGYGIDNAKLSYLSYLKTSDFSKPELLKSDFMEHRYELKYSYKDWNSESIDFMRGEQMIAITNLAYNLSKSDTLCTDLFISNMNYGQGQWPSWQTASYLYCTNSLYGSHLISQINLDSIYGLAFSYADITANHSYYTNNSNPIDRYFKDVTSAGNRLPFTLYVPDGWSELEGNPIPNVVETSNKAKIFTVTFQHSW
ncbi:hypothetical protein lbkm_2445 [Lachnospiraceae bacterium KM106-2]|nr:hypothetical protein lbkm_2445 [Lachnospiraceae bacterium KM106-2]